MTQLETPAKTPKRSRQIAKIEAVLKLNRESKSTEFKSKEFVSDSESETERGLNAVEERRLKTAEEAESDPGSAEEEAEEPAVVESDRDVQPEVPAVESEVISPRPPSPKYSGSFTDWEPTRPDDMIAYLTGRQSAAVSDAALPPLEVFLSPFAVNDDADPLVITHTSMNGSPFPGKWSIPFKEYGQFLRVLHHHMFVKGRPAFITERIVRGKAYKFFMDLDFDLETLRSVGLLAQGDHGFLDFIHGLVTDCVRETEVGRCWCHWLLISSKPGMVNKIHVHGDFDCQDPNLAKSITKRVEDWMKSNAPDVDWKKVFDTLPYEGGGLRMLGCLKSDGDVPYQIYNLHTKTFEPTTLGLMVLASIRSDAFGYSSGASCGGGSSSVDPETEFQVQEFVDHLRSTKAFGDQPLGLKKVRMSGRFINVALADTHCPYVGRAHKGESKRLYLFITHTGVWLKCWDTESCHHGRLRADLTEPMRMLMDQFPDEAEKIPEITEDVCGGGESDEETAVEQPRKTKSKKRRAPRAKRGEQTQGPTEPTDPDVLEKGVLTGLYNEKNGAHEQPSFTAYLNDFVTYVHANDSYGFRHNRNLPFVLGKKSTVANKLERYNSDFDAFSIWCRNDNRREFHQCVFDTSPKIYGPGVLNLFKGYKARLLDEEVSTESVEVFLYHIREIYCTGNERDYKFFLFWWAWVFQMGRTGVMIILMSLEKGTGKNILLELIAEHIIGDQYVATTDKITTITQKFNALNAEKVLIIANELKDATKSKKEQKGTVEVLKTLIKDRTMTIEKKGVDPLHGIPSTTNYIGTSNNVTPVKIDPDQRRFFALKVSDAKKGDSKYFETLSDFVKENADRIYTFLMQVDLTGWGPEKDMPQTEYVKEIQAAFRNPIYLFWDDSDWIKHDFNALPTNSEKIFDQYVGWCEKKRIPGTPAFPWFGRLVRELGYTVNRETRYGERAQWISGNMSENARKLANAN